jgi:cytochrome c peroxidase
MQIPSLHNQHQKQASILLVLICSVLFGMTSMGALALHANETIELLDRCPPYFSLNQEKNVCKLNSMYDLYPAANPQWGGYRVALPGRRDGYTPQQIDLGRYLFFDSILSADRDLSCAHCHHPEFSMSDGRSRSSGRHGTGVGPGRSGGADLPRAAPALWNMAFQQQFFWDGRAATLEDQIMTVLTAEDEMGWSPEQLVETLNASPAYRRLFLQAFGAESIEFEQVLVAIVAFETSLVSLHSRYDQYIHGAQNALSEQEINGLHVFRSFASRCSQCHTPPLFTSGQLVVTGIPGTEEMPFDVGAEINTGEPSLRGAFKVPSLRNIARTAPYMHAGQSQTLIDAINFYNDAPGHAVPDRSDLTLHWHVVNPNLTSHEITDLVAFLNTLTDETALPVTPARVPSGLPVP